MYFPTDTEDLGYLIIRREELRMRLSRLLLEPDRHIYIYDIMRCETLLSEVNELIERKLLGKLDNNPITHEDYTNGTYTKAVNRHRLRTQGVKKEPRLPEV